MNLGMADMNADVPEAVNSDSLQMEVAKGNLKII